MELQTEIVDVNKDYYFLNFDIYSENTVPVIKLLDANNNEVENLFVYYLPHIPQAYNEIVVDFERNLLMFHRNLIGKRIKVEYVSSGMVNTYKFHTDWIQILSNITLFTKYRILDGMYFYKEPFDENYTYRISKGSFIYNNIMYHTPEKVFDIRNYANINTSNVYQGYRFLITDITIENYGDNQRKILNDFTVIVSEPFGNYKDCKNNLIDKTILTFGNKPILVICDVIITINPITSAWEYFVEYDIKSRGVVEV